MSYAVGIDPGKHGAISVLQDGALRSWKFPKSERAAAQLIYDLCGPADFVAIERLTGWMGHSKYRPGSRMFVMGWWMGGPLFAAYLAAKDRVKPVMAHKWQRDLGVLSKGDKKALQEHCKRITGYGVSQQCADSALIAVWAAQKVKEKVYSGQKERYVQNPTAGNGTIKNTMATKTTKKAPAKAKAKTEKETSEKASYPVDSNYMLKRFQKGLAKSVFPGDENYSDYLELKKALHSKVTKFAQLVGFTTKVGKGDEAKEVELTAEAVLEALAEFFDGFNKA